VKITGVDGPGHRKQPILEVTYVRRGLAAIGAAGRLLRRRAPVQDHVEAGLRVSGLMQPHILLYALAKDLAA